MAKLDILNGLTRTIYKVGFQLKKHSPEILVGAGVVGVVASGVLACKATTKINTILDESKETVEKIHECANKPEMAEQYTEQDAKKDLTITYIQTGLKLVKLYAPSIALGAASIGCILTSHKIMKTRNVALAAAYATIDRSFKEYRGRVVDRFGKELDRELKYNIKAKEVEVTEIDENGEEKTVKKTIEVVDPTKLYSDYARVFECGNPGWDKNPEYTLMHLRQMQNTANDMLQTKGHVFLNEVYDLLGFPRTKAGQMVGWVYNEKNPVGDNFIDFGIYNIYNEKACDFVNGRERNVILDFNVDGVIYDLLA